MIVWIKFAGSQDHSNKISLALLPHGTICFSGFFQKLFNLLTSATFESRIPCEQKFRSGITFSIRKVVGVSCQSRRRLVFT